jgi:hypothetical protein
MKLPFRRPTKYQDQKGGWLGYIQETSNIKEIGNKKETSYKKETGYIKEEQHIKV